MALPAFRFQRLAVLALCASCAAPLAAHAADDGAAPLWEGIGAIVGLTPTDIQDPIDYRARGKLVLPPKMELPPPAASATNNPAWPQDPDLLRRRKDRAALNEAPAKASPDRPRKINDLSPDSTVVTMSATAGQGPTQRACPNGLKTLDCRPPHGIMSALGLQTTAPSQLGPEPDREWLTDPPKGYRAPSGAGLAVPAN